MWPLAATPGERPRTAVPPHAPEAAVPVRRRAARRLELPQVVCWQLSAAAVLAAYGRPWPVLAATATGAATLLALTAVRVRGRWLYQLAGRRWRFTLRRRRHVLPESAEKAAVLVRLLLRESAMRPLDTGHGTTAVISHGAGLTALLVPAEPVDPLAVPAPAALPAPPTGDGPAFAVQTVFHAGTRRGDPVRLWLAVCAVRTAAMPTDADLEPALRAELRRVRRSCKRSGITTAPPAEADVFAALTALAHITGGRNDLRENRRFWRTGPVLQACFTLDGLAALPEPAAAALTAQVLAVPLTGVAVTLTLAARSDDGEQTGVLRLAARTAADVDAAATRLTRLLSPAGVRLSRLDGGHFPAMAASLPLGGFPR
jgi:type VII secretion protein EccE